MFTSATKNLKQITTKIPKSMLQIKFRDGEKESWEQLSQSKKQIESPSKKTRKGKRKRGPKRLGAKLIKFHETPVGHYLMVYAPIEYWLLILHCATTQPNKGRTVRINHRSIELLAIHSDNPVFKTVGFRKALIDYRRHGLKVLRKTGWTLRDAIYYAKNSYHIYQNIKRCTEI